MMGNAAIQAAERARELITAAVAKKLEVPGNRIAFAERRVFDVQSPEEGLSFQDACQAAEARFGSDEIPLPPTWAGYRLYIARIELWVGALGRAQLASSTAAATRIT